MALDGVSLAVARGELLSIVGPNGAGKTTLVNVLTGLLKPTSGTVRFKGDDIAGIGPVALAKRGMARAFQLVHIFPAMTVAQTIGVAVVSQASKSFRMFASVRNRHGPALARARGRGNLRARHQARHRISVAVAGREEAARYCQRLCFDS